MGKLASSAGAGRTSRRPVDRRPMDQCPLDGRPTSRPQPGRRRQTALLAAALVAAIATLVAAGLVCGLVQALAGTGSPAPSGKIVLRVGLVNELDDLNPFIGTSTYVILAYPKGLEAVDTSRWTGWVQSPSGVGSAIYSTDNIDSYLYVHPVQTGGAATAKSNGPLITFLVTAAIAVVLVVFAVVLRRRRPKAEETEERS